MQKSTKQNVEMLVTLALLTALEVIMSRFLSVNSTFFKLDTSFIPMALAAYFYGPIGGMIAAGLGDFIGALLFPFGPYMPHFTISAALTGFIFGLALKGRPNMVKVLLAVVPSQIICSLMLNSLFLELLYGNVIFWIRLVQTLITTPIQTIVTYFVVKKVVPLVKIRRIEKKRK